MKNPRERISSGVEVFFCMVDAESFSTNSASKTILTQQLRYTLPKATFTRNQRRPRYCTPEIWRMDTLKHIVILKELPFFQTISIIFSIYSFNFWGVS